MSDERMLIARFAAYRRDLSDDVQAPGVEAVHRTVLHRQRHRNVLAGALAVLALGAVVARFAMDGGPQTGPVSPASPTLTVQASPEASGSGPSTGPSSAAPSSTPPSSRPPSSRPPSSRPSGTATTPPEQVPAHRTYPVVDGLEMHVVALAEVRLQPVNGVYRGIVYVDVYNSGRQPSSYSHVFITLPAGVEWDTSTANPTMGGCVGAPPETWTCPAEAVPAGGGYRRMPFTMRVNIAPGQATQVVDGFAVRVMAADSQGKPADVTPADNKATVRLVLPPA
jgi:hypothetical protein